MVPPTIYKTTICISRGPNNSIPGYIPNINAPTDDMPLKVHSDTTCDSQQLKSMQMLLQECLWFYYIYYVTALPPLPSVALPDPVGKTSLAFGHVLILNPLVSSPGVQKFHCFIFSSEKPLCLLPPLSPDWS